MKLLLPTEVKFGLDPIVFRQGRLAGTIRSFVLGGIFAAGGPVLGLFGAPWFVWLPCLAVGCLPALFFLRCTRALFRESNWILATDRKVVWINLRSHLNYHLPEGQTVLRLETSEIESVRVYDEKYSTPNSDGGSTNWAMKSVQLKLTHGDTQDLAHALEEERKREAAPKKFSGSIKAQHYPVSVPEAGTIRIAWRGSKMEDQVAPGASRAIQLLAAAGARTEEPALQQRGDWSHLEGDALEARVRELAQSSHCIEAIELLRLRRGLGLTEATRRVKEMQEGGSGPKKEDHDLQP